MCEVLHLGAQAGRSRHEEQAPEEGENLRTKACSHGAADKVAASGDLGVALGLQRSRRETDGCDKHHKNATHIPFSRDGSGGRHHVFIRPIGLREGYRPMCPAPMKPRRAVPIVDKRSAARMNGAGNGRPTQPMPGIALPSRQQQYV